MGREKKPKRFWGIGSWEFRQSEAVKHLTPDAISVHANITAQIKNVNQRNGEPIPWGYENGPVRMNSHQIARGLFILFCLGIIEIAEPSIFVNHGGNRRKTRYKIIRKWAYFNPEYPGKFLISQQFVNYKWKKCFDDNGKLKKEFPDIYYAAKKRNFPLNKSKPQGIASLRLLKSMNNPIPPVTSNLEGTERDA